MVKIVNNLRLFILIGDQNSAPGCPSKDAVNTSLALCQLHAGKAFAELPGASLGAAEI